MKNRLIFFVLSGLILLLFIANIFLGSVKIPAQEIVDILLGRDCSRESWYFIIINSRIPQAVTALLCGASLAVSGLMLQTVFANPLAGPSILGISSGANLGVAIVMLCAGGTIPFLNSSASSISPQFSLFTLIIFAAFLGSMAVMALILFFSSFIHNNLALLIIGIMIGYVTTSAISLLNFFSTAEGVHSYVIWGMGNFGGVSLQWLPVFAIMSILGLSMAALLIKPLNALLLGNQYAINLGINIRRTRNLLIISTGLLTALTTAFCGPIAFFGLAIPHIARMLLGTNNHKPLMPVTILTGSALALFCNLICTLPGENGIIPLNAITPLLGAPIIVYVTIKSKID